MNDDLLPPDSGQTPSSSACQNGREQNSAFQFGLSELMLVMVGVSVLSANYLHVWRNADEQLPSHYFRNVLPIARSYMFAWILAAILVTLILRRVQHKLARRLLTIFTVFALIGFAYNMFVVITTM